MVEISQAVDVLMEPQTSQEAKKRALEYLEGRKKEGSFYKEVMREVTLMGPQNRAPVQVAFFYFQTIEEFVQNRYLMLSEEEKREMHQFLEGLLQGNPGLLTLHLSLLNKFALIYARVLIHDFPQSWPTSISALLSLYPQAPVYRMILLSVLQMIHEEAIDDETRRQDIKFPQAKLFCVIIKDRVLPLALPIWKSELGSDSPDLKSATLTVCSRYIGLLSLENALELIPLVTRHIKTCQVPVLHCIQSLIRKAMSTEQKLRLISDLQILDFLREIDYQAIDDEGSELLKALSMVINALGVELLECRDWERLWQVLNLAFRVFTSSQPIVSRTVFEFFRGFIHMLKVKGDMTPPESLTPAELNAVGNLCMMLMQRAQVPTGFSYRGRSNSDEEDQFYMFREELAELFKEVMKLETMKSPVLELISDKIRTVLSQENVVPELLEVLLFLLFQYLDCLTDLHQILTTESQLTFLTRFLLSSRIPPHPLVMRQLFDLGVRLASFFDMPQNEGFLGVLLHPMLEMMSSPDMEMSGFAVKRVIGLIIKAQKPALRYSEEIIEAAKVVIAQGFLDEPSVLKLFRALGLLLGNPAVSPELKYRQIAFFSQALLTACTPGKLQQLAELLGGIGRRGDVDFQGNLLSLFTYIADRVSTGPLEEASYEAVASLVHKFTVCLETEASPAVEKILTHMANCLSLGTVDCVMKLVCNVVQTGVLSIPPSLLSKVTSLLISQVPIPRETISDLSQDLISHRRGFIKMLEALVTKGLDLTTQSCFSDLLDYVRGITSNSNESIVI